MTSGRIWLWIWLGVAIALGVIWQFYPLPDASQRLHSLPLFGKGFIGRNVPLTDFEREAFKSVNLIKRLYRVGEQNLFITVLDGSRNRHVVHDPFYCFRGGGWELKSQQAIPLPDGQAMLLYMTKDEASQEAAYWFSDGHNHYDSPFRYWLQATLRRLTLGWSSPEPVLVIVQPVDGKSLDLPELFEAFPDLLRL